MTLPAVSSQVWRFGLFEADARREELRRAGLPIGIRRQSFLILLFLLEHAGEIVTREQLRVVLWPNDVFVDFDHSLNTAMMKLRELLGDTADKPLYIETIPRRGYRFIAPAQRVEEADPTAGEPAADGADGTGGTANGTRGGVAAATAGTAAKEAELRRLGRSPPAYAALLIAVALLLVAVALLKLTEWRGPPAHSGDSAQASLARPIESIAVLPLENLSRDPDQEYFADGLTDTLIANLGQVSTLRVISRSSVMRYKRSVTPLSEIAAELNVDALVEGTVQRSGQRVRITIQLVDGRDDSHLWANIYERGIEDVIALERDLSLAIAHEISGRLTPALETQLRSHSPGSMAAYDAYLHGRYLLGERTAAGESGARAYFQEALDADPKFALAWTGLADSYAVGWYEPADLPQAEQFAQKAVSLAPDLAEAHASLGIIDVYELQFEAGAKELRRALELNPNYAMAHHWYALYLLATGSFARAMAENERARQLDPFSLPINYLRGNVFLAMREYELAVQQFEMTKAIAPASAAPQEGLLRIAWIQKKVPEAVTAQQAAAAAIHDQELMEDARAVEAAYANSGERAAGELAALLKEKRYRQHQHDALAREHRLCSAFDIALQYALLNDREKALGWLRQALREKTQDFTLGLMGAPEFDSLRDDPRFAALKAEFLGTQRRGSGQPGGN